MDLESILPKNKIISAVITLKERIRRQRTKGLHPNPEDVRTLQRYEWVLRHLKEEGFLSDAQSWMKNQ